MAADGAYGLLKFFSNEDYLDSFIDGLVHFSTPETFRRSKQEGVGDMDESASATFRRDRGDDDVWEVTVKEDDGSWTPVPGVESITIRNTGHPDRWLHCWMELRIDDGGDGLGSFAEDLERVLNEFGKQFVFLPAKNVQSFLDRLRSAAPDAELGMYKVSYTDETHRLGPYCKRTMYAYQREVRLMLDECDEHELEPRQIVVAGGFSDIIDKSPGLRITEEDGRGRILTLNPAGRVEWS